MAKALSLGYLYVLLLRFEVSLVDVAPLPDVVVLNATCPRVVGGHLLGLPLSAGSASDEIRVNHALEKKFDAACCDVDEIKLVERVIDLYLLHG